MQARVPLTVHQFILEFACYYYTCYSLSLVVSQVGRVYLSVFLSPQPVGPLKWPDSGDIALAALLS